MNSNTTEIGAKTSNRRVGVGSIGLRVKTVFLKTGHFKRVKNGFGRVRLHINHQPNPPDPADLQSLVH